MRCHHFVVVVYKTQWYVIDTVKNDILMSDDEVFASNDKKKRIKFSYLIHIDAFFQISSQVLQEGRFGICANGVEDFRVVIQP